MSRPITKAELIELLHHIRQEHSPVKRLGGKTIKYVDPHIDMRDGAVFSVTFRGYGWEETLHTQNECRDLPETLFERCMAWLDEGSA